MLLITCNKQYVGETGNKVSDRFAQHRGYVNNFANHKAADKKIQATVEHFNLPGHAGVRDIRLTIIEKVFVKTKQMRLVREAKFIKEFQTDYKGINKR